MQVRLIGYSMEGSLFLVYEYIENGNLSQHLRGSGCMTLGLDFIFTFDVLKLSQVDSELIMVCLIT